MKKSSLVRRAEVRRKTKETEVRVSVDLDSAGPPSVSTGIGFFDHMLDALGTHGRLGLEVDAKGDLHVDQHHTVEDVGIALGTAIRQALGDDPRIERFAHAYAPLDDSLTRVVIDICGRAYLRFDFAPTRALVGDFDTDLVREFFQALVANARINLHATLLHGENTHHQIESLFKATALALRSALRVDPSLRGAPSTKGTLDEDAAQSSRSDVAKGGSA